MKYFMIGSWNHPFRQAMMLEINGIKMNKVDSIEHMSRNTGGISETWWVEWFGPLNFCRMCATDRQYQLAICDSWVPLPNEQRAGTPGYVADVAFSYAAYQLAIQLKFCLLVLAACFFSSSQAPLKRYRTVLPFNLSLIFGIGWGHPRDGLPLKFIKLKYCSDNSPAFYNILHSNPHLFYFSPSFSFGSQGYHGLPRFSGPLQEGVLEVPPGGGRLIQVLEDWWRHRSLMTLSYMYISYIYTHHFI